MRSSSLYSIQPPDPYRNRRCSTKADESCSPTTPKSTTQLIFKPESGRAHSYLPYSNHPPDLVQSTRAELYLEEEEDAMTLSSSQHQVMDMINGERNNSMMTQQVLSPEEPLHRCKIAASLGLKRDMSLIDKLHYKRQKKQQHSHFHTTTSRRLFLFFSIMIFLGIIAIVIYFVWPRTPRLILKSEKVERMGDPADWGPNQQPWLRASWRLNMTLDNSVNFVTTNINDIELVLVDRDTNKPFAWSKTGPIHLAPYKETLFSLIFRVDFESQSINDTTFKNLYNACGPQIPTESPTLNLTMQAGNRFHYWYNLENPTACSSTRGRIVLSIQLIAATPVISCHYYRIINILANTPIDGSSINHAIFQIEARACEIESS